MRAVVSKADGTGRRVLAEDVTREKLTWTQFVGWSPDGKTAIFGRGWKSEENGKWEEEHRDFSLITDGYLYDSYLFELAGGKATTVTAVERASNSTVALGFMPATPPKLPFPAPAGG